MAKGCSIQTHKRQQLMLCYTCISESDDTGKATISKLSDVLMLGIVMCKGQQFVWPIWCLGVNFAL